MDRFSTTMKLINELCERITGIAYQVDIDERHRAFQKKRQQEIKQNVITGTVPKKKQKVGRPKGSAGNQENKIKKDYAHRNAKIRQRHFQDGVSQKDLVHETRLSPTTISNIVNQKGQQ